MTRAKLAVSFIFLMLGVFISQATHAAKITQGVINFQGEQIRFVKIKGSIVEGDSDKLNTVVERYADTDAPVIIALLDSRGGDVDESNDMVDIILDNDISTAVMPKTQCLSACFAVFAAGSGRYLYPESIVGVHRAISEGFGDDLDAKITSLQMAKLYNELDVPAAISKKMLKTPPGEMYYLTQQEKRAMSTEKSVFIAPVSPRNQSDIDKMISESLNGPAVTAAGDW